MISGNLNTKEIIELINQRAEECGETLIRDNDTIKRIVVMLLGKDSEEYKKYEEALRHCIGARSPKSLKMRFEGGGKELIIQNYLPRILSGEINFETMRRELKTSDETILKIIRAYYANDKEGFETFKQAVSRNLGVSIERKRRAKQMRSKVAGGEIVSSAEFILIPEEKQDIQIVMKIRKEKLKEELSQTSKAKTAITSEEATRVRIERIKNYFRSKKDPEEGKIYFSEPDIRAMIFAFPTLINRSNQTLDKKFDLLVSFDYPNLTGIPDESLDANNKISSSVDRRNYEIVYGMVKTFPGILGYSLERIEKQLSLLQSEKLLDHVISKPEAFRISPETMYALISFAKERHKTADLSGVSRSNIFMSNSSLKRVYGVTYEDIKKRYPLPSEMVIPDDQNCYSLDGNALGEAGRLASPAMRKKAGVVLDMVTFEKGEPIVEKN